MNVSVQKTLRSGRWREGEDVALLREEEGGRNARGEKQMTRVGEMEFPTLALAPSQFAMIANLDGLGWDKFPVHINKARHSHAAIIVRMNRESFDEGKVVIGHFLDRFKV